MKLGPGLGLGLGLDLDSGDGLGSGFGSVSHLEKVRFSYGAQAVVSQRACVTGLNPYKRLWNKTTRRIAVVWIENCESHEEPQY